MKHINESIIGRRGTHTSVKLWLLYPVSNDFHTALKVLPDDCRIYWDSMILFCVNRQQLKEFFDSLPSNNTFTSPESALFELGPQYLRNFKDVEKWIERLYYAENDFNSIYRAKESNLIIVNIPKYIENL